jgi:RHS repeat-associated protein
MSANAESTEVLYYRARYYDPQTGRFLSEDPLRFAASTNFYPYVSANPVLKIDPSGLIHQAWNEPPYDGRLHDDANGGLEVLCTRGRNKQQDIWWLQYSIAVRFIEIVRKGNNADLGHIERLVLESIALARCKGSCDEKPESEPPPDDVNENDWWKYMMRFIQNKVWMIQVG